MDLNPWEIQENNLGKPSKSESGTLEICCNQVAYCLYFVKGNIRFRGSVNVCAARKGRF